MGFVGGEELTQGPGEREEKIFVSIRVRPLNQKESARNDVSDWECINDTTIIYRNNLSVSERSMYPTGYTFGKEVLSLPILKISSLSINPHFCFSIGQSVWSFCSDGELKVFHIATIRPDITQL